VEEEFVSAGNHSDFHPDTKPLRNINEAKKWLIRECMWLPKERRTQIFQSAGMFPRKETITKTQPGILKNTAKFSYTTEKPQVDTRLPQYNEPKIAVMEDMFVLRDLMFANAENPSVGLQTPIWGDDVENVRMLALRMQAMRLNLDKMPKIIKATKKIEIVEQFIKEHIDLFSSENLKNIVEIFSVIKNLKLTNLASELRCSKLFNLLANCDAINYQDAATLSEKLFDDRTEDLISIGESTIDSDLKAMSLKHKIGINAVILLNLTGSEDIFLICKCFLFWNTGG
jgi:hypothetical protein